MAIIKAVRSRGGCKKIIDYVTRMEKTEGKYICTLNCSLETAAEEFKVTKQIYGKDGGTQYFHFIQSFKPGEKISPQDANSLAKQLAINQFPNYEVVIGTHIDRDHIHSHIVVNSVNLDTGKKLHMAKRDLQVLKDRSDELCLERGLPIIQKERTSEEIRSYDIDMYAVLKKAAEGRYKSYVLDTAVTVANARELSFSKEDFIDIMSAQGYQVKWEDSHKYITYTDPGGHKVRSRTLSKTFNQNFEKEAMEIEFERNSEKEIERERFGESGHGGRSFSYGEQEKIYEGNSREL